MTINNQLLFLLINSFAGKDQLLDITGIILGEYMPFVFIAIEVYLYFFKKKQDEALFAFYAMITALLINQITGLFYFHNRPFMDGIGKVISFHLSDNSFPSDHTAFMLAIAWSLFLSKETKKTGLILIFLGIIGGSFRIFLGVHYPFDILGGIITGLVGALIIHLCKKYLYIPNRLITNITDKFFRKDYDRNS